MGIALGGEIYTLKDTDGSWEVVYTSGSTESGHDDGGSWDQVVGECIVKVALGCVLADFHLEEKRRGGT